MRPDATYRMNMYKTFRRWLKDEWRLTRYEHEMRQISRYFKRQYRMDVTDADRVGMIIFNEECIEDAQLRWLGDIQPVLPFELLQR